MTIDGETYPGIGQDTVWVPDGWASAPSRYEIAALAGVSTMTVTRN